MKFNLMEKVVFLNSNFKNVISNPNLFFNQIKFTYVNNINCENMKESIDSQLTSCFYFQNSRNKFIKNVSISNNFGKSSAVGIILINDERFNNSIVIAKIKLLYINIFCLDNHC